MKKNVIFMILLASLTALAILFSSCDLSKLFGDEEDKVTITFNITNGYSNDVNKVRVYDFNESEFKYDESISIPSGQNKQIKVTHFKVDGDKKVEGRLEVVFEETPSREGDYLFTSKNRTFIVNIGTDGYLTGY